MYTHFSVVLLLFGPARTHSIMRYVCEYRVHCIKCSRFFRQHAAAAVVAYGACTEETGSKRGVNGTRLRQWGLQGYTPVSIDPSGEEGKKGPISLSPQARRPSSTGELIAPLYHSLLMQLLPSLRTQPWSTGHRSPPSS